MRASEKRVPGGVPEGPHLGGPRRGSRRPLPGVPPVRGAPWRGYPPPGGAPGGPLLGVPPLPSYQRLHQRAKMGLVRRVGHVPVRTLEGGSLTWAIFWVPPPGGGYPPKMAPRDPPNRPPGRGYPRQGAPRTGGTPQTGPRGPPPGGPLRGPFSGPLPGTPGGPPPDPGVPRPGPLPRPRDPLPGGGTRGSPLRDHPQTPQTRQIGRSSPKLGKLANFRKIRKFPKK